MLALRTAFVNGFHNRLLTSLLFATAFLSVGCNGIVWGNLGVLCVTVGIFLGTVFLSRSSTATRSAARAPAGSTTPSVAPPGSRG